MTDDAAPFQPGRAPATVPFRPRGEFAGYRAFGSGDGAVLMDLEKERGLRLAAESATQRQRVAGGLLYGRGWTDDQGSYLVIDGFLEVAAGEPEPGEDSGDRDAASGAGQFTLSEADLRLLRGAAAQVYPASLEVGWWRTLAALGEFSPRDFMTQAELVGPDGVGLLVYGSGVHWGTAYLGPDGHAPDTAGTLVTATDFVYEVEPEPDPGPELVDISAGEHLAEDPIPLADSVYEVRATGLSDAAAEIPLAQQVKRRSPRRARRRGPARARVRAPRRGPAPAPAPGMVIRREPEPEVPRDVRLVAGALAGVAVLAAVIVGVLLHSLVVAVIIAVIVVLVVVSSVWLSRRW